MEDKVKEYGDAYNALRARFGYINSIVESINIVANRPKTPENDAEYERLKIIIELWNEKVETLYGCYCEFIDKGDYENILKDPSSMIISLVCKK